MTQEEYNGIEWNCGNRVMLTNGKEYPVCRQKKRFLLLYSAEYEAYFIADHHIIDCRTSDAIEHLNVKVARSDGGNGVGECVCKPQPVKEATAAPCIAEAAVAEKPKRKRTRIVVQHTEKIEL